MLPFFVSFVKSVHSWFALRDFGWMKFSENSCLVNEKFPVMFVLFFFIVDCFVEI